MSDIKSRWRKDWEKTNPVLRRGEPGHERNSGKIKIGDGKTPWLLLPFVPDAGLTDITPEMVEAKLPARLGQTALRETYVAPRPALLNLHAALSGAPYARCDILIAGTSLAEGYGASAWSRRVTSLLQDSLRSRFPSGAAGGVGFIPTRYNFSGAAADAWTLGGTTYNQARGLGLRGKQLAIGATATISRSCTRVRLHFHRLAADTVTISIDGGAAATYTLPATGSRDSVWDSGALTAGSHTVVVTSTAGGGAVLCGGEFMNGDENIGVHVWDASYSGAKAGTFLGAAGTSGSTDWADWITAANINPDVVILEPLVNDVPTLTASTYKDDMSALIDLVRSKTSAPILLMPHWKPLDRAITSPWEDYLAACADLATSKTGVLFFNMSSRVPPQTGDPNGLLADAIHLNDKGQALHELLWRTALLPV